MAKHKKINKKAEKIYKVDNRSNQDTFLKWLDECGNDLQYFSGVLSCCGSDGPNITEDKVGKAHFNIPKEVEDYLQDQGLYEKKKVMFNTNYNPPSEHYIDWFNKKYPEND